MRKFKTRFKLAKSFFSKIYSSLAVDGGEIKESCRCEQGSSRLSPRRKSKEPLSRRVSRRRIKLKTQQSPIILDLCLTKTWSAKSRDYRDVIVVKKLRFQNVFRPHENEKPAFSNSSFLKLFHTLFCQLENTSALSATTSTKERFRKAPVFRDGLVWTVDQLRFQIPPSKCGRSLK